MRYPYSYYIRIKNKDDSVLDELLILIMKQVRISTRRRTIRWEMRMDYFHLRVRFEVKGDYNDFAEAFKKDNADFLQQYGFIEAEPKAEPEPESPAPAFDWDGYVNRLAGPHRRQ